MTTDSKPRGRDPVRAALIEAAARLFSERGPQGVSVREIAAAAGVNHGLVHRHFGSKEGLLRETMHQLAHDVMSGLSTSASQESLRHLMLAVFGAARQGRHLQILARSILEGRPPEELQQEFPVVARMLAAAGRSKSQDLAPEARVTLLLSIGLGLMLFEPYLKASTGQDDIQWATTRRDVGQWVLDTMTDDDSATGK